MASPPPTSFFIHLLLLLVSFSSSSIVASKYPIKALVLPLKKDRSTLQYITTIHQRTPSVPITLSVHLGGIYLSLDCQHESYMSSTYRPVRCRTVQCSATRSRSCRTCNGPARPGCNNDTCGSMPENPFIRLSLSGEFAEDAVMVRTTDGSGPGRLVTANRFVFACSSSSLLEGLAKGAKGVAGLGRSQLALPSQFAATFGFHRKFAMCLPSSTGDNGGGVIFFGDGPYNFLPKKIDVSKHLTYTPLLTNPNSTAGAFFEGDPSYEYFIGVKSIQVNEHTVRLNTSLLNIDNGIGGTKISTVNPYTILETSIYKSIAKAFTEESGLTRVSSVSPFEHCFDGRKVSTTILGPAVPQIKLVLQSKRVVWSILGANSMVEAKPGVLCLGFVDGGRDPRTSMVIGGLQLEDNLFQFDLAASRFGFGSSLLRKKTSCSNFNLKLSID